MTIGTSLVRRIERQTSKPSMPGSMMSISTTSVGWRLNVLEGVLAVVGLLDGPALVLEGHLDRGADALVVLDGQDAGSHRPMVPDRGPEIGRYPSRSSVDSGVRLRPAPAVEQQRRRSGSSSAGRRGHAPTGRTAVRRARLLHRRRRPRAAIERAGGHVPRGQAQLVVRVDPAAGHRAEVERPRTRPGGCRGRGRSCRRATAGLARPAVGVVGEAGGEQGLAEVGHGRAP